MQIYLFPYISYIYIYLHIHLYIMTYPECIIFTIIWSWANGWTTSHRMPEPALLPCILGCPGEIDSLSHYLRCDRLWRALKVALRRCSLALPSPFFSAPILAKLAVLNTEKTSVVMLCALSHAYHVIKNNFLGKLRGGLRRRCSGHYK